MVTGARWAGLSILETDDLLGISHNSSLGVPEWCKGDKCAEGLHSETPC